MYTLGKMYLYGLGAPRNYEAAYEWIGKAGESGVPAALYNIAKMTRDGIGTEPDAEIAFELYRRAAEGRHARAQAALAIRYAEGDGTPPSEERALYWAYRAYKNGVEKAAETMDDMSEVLGQEAAKAIMAEAEIAEAK